MQCRGVGFHINLIAGCLYSILTASVRRKPPPGDCHVQFSPCLCTTLSGGWITCLAPASSLHAGAVSWLASKPGNPSIKGMCLLRSAWHTQRALLAVRAASPPARRCSQHNGLTFRNVANDLGHTDTRIRNSSTARRMTKRAYSTATARSCPSWAWWELDSICIKLLRSSSARPNARQQTCS